MNPVEITSIIHEAVAQAMASFSPVPRAFLNTEEAAHYLSLSTYQLEIWRSQGDGPPYMKLARAVRYSRADLDEWMAARRQSHTSQNR